MSFWKRNIGFNPFLSGRLVYLQLHEIKDTRNKLEAELTELEAQLQSERGTNERASIQAQIQGVQEELRRLESATTPVTTMLLSGLQNNIDAIDSEIGKTTNAKKREQLEQKKASQLEALKARQAEITSQEELEEAVDQIDHDERLLTTTLTHHGLDQIDISLILSSDMIAFIDHEFEGQLRAAYEQMITNDDHQRVLGPNAEQLRQETDGEWLSYKQSVEGNITALEARKAELEDKLRTAGVKEKIGITAEIHEVESQIKHSRDQIENKGEAWNHRTYTLKEQRISTSVDHIAHPDTLEKLKRLLMEAEMIRQEKVYKYMETQYSALEARLEEVKGEGIFGAANLKAIEEKLAEGRREIMSRFYHPGIMKRLAKNLAVAQRFLNSSIEEMTDLKEHRAEVEEKVRSQFGELQSAVKAITPDHVEEFKKRYTEEMKRKGFKVDSKVLAKTLNAFDQLADPNSPAHADIKAYEAQMPQLSNLSPEELLMLKLDLEALAPKLTRLSKLGEMMERASTESIAQAAHRTIDTLEAAESIAEIREVLAEELGDEHVLYVDHATFESKYSDGNKEGGHMLFEEDVSGGGWRIVIDKSFLQPDNLEKVKEEIIHELLHLEFEKNLDTKERIRNKFLEEHKEEWPAIEEAFDQMVADTDKAPPHGDTWTVDDKLSEIYAMQQTMGNGFSHGDTSTDKLNNLLTGAGLGKALKEVVDQTDNYQSDSDAGKIRRRFQAGVEKGEEAIGTGEGASETTPTNQNEELYTNNKKEIEALDKRIGSLLNSPHLSYAPGAGKLLRAMREYNNATADLNGDLNTSAGGLLIRDTVKERIAKLTTDLVDTESKIGKAGKKAPNNEISLLRKLWINTTFLSLADIGQVGVDAVEFLQRRHKRKKSDHAAKLGMALFHGTDLGREASAREQAAEAEEVQEWQKRYENKDAWELISEIKNLANTIDPSKDQLKAILRILAQKGRINWRDENLWKVLNRLQSSVSLKPGDTILLHDPILLRETLHKALGSIWDYDEFTTLERQNESSYEGEKSKYDTVHDRMQDSLTGRLDELLAQHRHGEPVDPILYESIMEYCIKNGKSFAENVMFHLIVGMADGLLAPDRGLALGKHLNAWPSVDWFTTLANYSADDFKHLCEKEFKESYKNGNCTDNRDYINWYWRVIQNEQKVVERVQKSVGERGWDHDWGRSIACLGDADTAKRFLAGRSGQQETKVTAVANAYVGAVQWIEENALKPGYADKKQFARMAGWVAMSEGILKGTAYNRKENDISTRQNESMNSARPRERTLGRHGDATLREHRDIAKRLLNELDPDFFDLISSQECRSDERKKALGTAAAQYIQTNYGGIAEEFTDVETIDQIYDRLDLIIQHMFDRMTDAEFQGKLANIAAQTPKK